MAVSKIIIVDPQNDFTCVDGFYAKKHREINQISAAKRKINGILGVAAKDQVVVMRSDYREDQFEKGLTICAPGTFGNAIDKDMAIDESYTVITKTEHSGFTSKGFLRFLEETATTHLFLCGFLAEYCVKQTGIDALEQGYSVSLITDCIGTGDDVQGRKLDMMEELQSKGAKVVGSEVVIEDILRRVF